MVFSCCRGSWLLIVCSVWGRVQILGGETGVSNGLNVDVHLFWGLQGKVLFFLLGVDMASLIVLMLDGSLFWGSRGIVLVSRGGFGAYWGFRGGLHGRDFRVINHL